MINLTNSVFFSPMSFLDLDKVIYNFDYFEEIINYKERIENLNEKDLSYFVYYLIFKYKIKEINYLKEIDLFIYKSYMFNEDIEVPNVINEIIFNHFNFFFRKRNLYIKEYPKNIKIQSIEIKYNSKNIIKQIFNVEKDYLVKFKISFNFDDSLIEFLNFQNISNKIINKNSVEKRIKI